MNAQTITNKIQIYYISESTIAESTFNASCPKMIKL